jgi:competence protein ComGC
MKNLQPTTYHPQTQKSFTLIELLLYLAIVTVVLTSLVLFAWNIIETGAKSGNQEMVTSEAKMLSEKIGYQIRNANDINIASSNFGVNLATTPGNKISLANNAPNNPTLIDALNGQARITLGASAAVTLNSTNTNLTNLTFINYTSVDGKTKNLQYTLTLQSKYPSHGNVYESVTLENAAEVRSH